MMRKRHFTIALIATLLTLAACRGQDTYQSEAQRLAPILKWQPGSVVADVGAGDGEMTLAVAERVGTTGRVYSTEIDDGKLARLQEMAGQHQNITALKSAVDATNLPPAGCDSIILRRVYHHIVHPARFDASLFASLKPGGMLAVIDFPPRDWLPKVHESVPGIRSGHGVAKQLVIEELTAAGFEMISAPDDWPDSDYCVIFRKPGD
jgi:ubiquinone/menaquinone biosynthesis C-methylase UbiE